MAAGHMMQVSWAQPGTAWAGPYKQRDLAPAEESNASVKIRDPMTRASCPHAAVLRGIGLSISKKNSPLKEQCCTAQLPREGGSPTLGVFHNHGAVALRDVGSGHGGVGLVISRGLFQPE